MPKPQYQLKPETVSSLLKELQRVTNCKLQSHSDAIKIAEILNSKNYQISPHTISRLAGILKSNTKPYLYNINSIAQFLNFHDVFAFEAANNLGSPDSNANTILESRALLAFELSNPSDFVEYYSGITPLTPSHIRLTHKIVNEFVVNTKRGQLFIEAMEKSENARLSFYHHFVDEDNQGSYFLNSIERIYTSQKLSSHEKVFYEEYANNKYYERNAFGLIPQREFKTSFKSKLAPEHIDFPHLYSRMFVNYIYHKAFNGGLTDRQLESLLKQGIQQANDTNYIPFRLAWLGRLVRAFLYINAEHILRKSVAIKQEILWAMGTEYVDYEFQSVLQFAGFRLGILNENKVRSFKGGWYNAFLSSSAWDLMSTIQLKSDDPALSKKLIREVGEIARIVDNKLMANYFNSIV